VPPAGPGLAKLLGIKVPSFTVPLAIPQGWFSTKLERGVAPEGFEGEWRCVKLDYGGWGCVYLAERGGHRVVFKVPRGYEGYIEGGIRRSVLPKILENISRRAEIIRRLVHPHILKLLGYSKSAPILVYEYANYGTLEWQLARGWSPSLKDVLLIAIQVGDALRYIHSRGLIHGDVKPDNIFIVDGVAKIGDFSGLVTLLSSLSEIHYTPGFRAPEQCYSDLKRVSVERGLENRIDVYQLANTILFTLTRESLDGEEALNDAARARVLSKVGDAELRSLLNSMLSANPCERPSMDEVLTRLYEIYVRLST